MAKKDSSKLIPHTANFDNHIIHKTIESIIKKFDNEGLVKIIEANSSDSIINAIFYIQERLTIVRKDIIDTNLLSTVNNELSQANNNLTNLINSPEHIANYLAAINNSIFNALYRINQIPTYPLGNEELMKLIDASKIKIENDYKAFEERQKKAEENINLINNKIKEREKQLLDIETQLKQKEATLKVLTDAFQKDIELIKTNGRDQFNSTNESFKKEIEKRKTEILQNIEDETDNLESKMVEVDELIGIIGNKGITGNYNIIAKYNRLQANIFRVVSIFIMLILSGILIYSIWDIPKADIEWHKIAIRVFSVSILIYPAIYCAKESNKHREQETINRKAELELASIGPFIATLEEDVQQKIKEKLADKYFGNSLIKNEVDDTQGDLIPLNAIDKIVDNFVKVAKSTGAK